MTKNQRELLAWLLLFAVALAYAAGCDRSPGRPATTHESHNKED